MSYRTSQAEEKMAKAVFAGGCFWCMEAEFDKLPGVKEVVSGYIGGTEADPTYQDYAAKGYIEAVEISYDPQVVTYGRLLDYFWRHIDPVDAAGQFCDRGQSYTSAIFYRTPEQQREAEGSKKELERSGVLPAPVATRIVEAGRFYPAEDYHQDYHTKSAVKYKFYRFSCGRDRRINQLWGDAADFGKLTPLQCKVTQEGGTEPAFNNAYWDNKKEGIYVDIVSGEPLFSSGDKYESGTGWPSFTKPLEPDNIVEKEDRSGFSVRTEIRSRRGDSHLGHVFNDGPPPTGLRYCMNSAALKFIPKQDLAKEGYGKYEKIFEK